MQLIKKTTLAYALIILAFCSCENKSEKTEKNIAVDSTRAFRILYDSIVLTNADASRGISYYYYCPEKNDSTVLPLLILLDPQGESGSAINKYINLSKKHGFILISLPSIKNGVKTNEAIAILSAAIKDAITKTKTDIARIYMAGFSGGARIASAYAIGKGGINGVILSGAGFGTKQQPVQKFSIFLTAGSDDFNLSEILTLSNNLATTDFPNAFVPFEGKHEWPPQETMDDALMWLKINEIKQGFVPNNKQLLEECYTKQTEKLNLYIRNKNKTFEYQTYSFISTALNGLAETSVYSQKKSAIESVVKKTLASQMQSDKILQDVYYAAFTEKDVEWWEKEVQKINKEAKNAVSASDKSSIARLKGFLSVAAYGASNSALNSGDFNNAEKYISIYSLVDPDNPEHAFMRALLLARQKKYEGALLSLERAADLGFKEISRITGQPDLAEIFNRFGSDINNVMEKIKKNNR